MAGRKLLAPPYYSQRAVFTSPPSAFFVVLCWSFDDKNVEQKDDNDWVKRCITWEVEEI